MTKTIPAHELTLRQVEARFGLSQVHTPGFFPQWQGDLPDWDAYDRRRLDQARADFLYLAKDRERSV
jgi:hypothetical protein